MPSVKKNIFIEFPCILIALLPFFLITGPFLSDLSVVLVSLFFLYNTIKEKDRTHGLCRLIAGYSWPWKSQKNKAEMDITIDGVNLQWNSTNEDWILSKNAVNEVGCIHTTQGYDLNYAGIIIGHDIGYDPSIDNIVIYKENYFDKNGKHGVEDLSKLKTFIIISIILIIFYLVINYFRS